MPSFPLLKAAFTATPAWLSITLFFVSWAIAWLPLAVPLAIAFNWRPPQPITTTQKLPLLASLYLLAPLVLWGVATLQETSFAAYGLPWNASILVSLSVGLIAGVVSILALFALQWRLGWLKWCSPLAPDNKTGSPLGYRLILTLLLGVWVSFTEELIFRGFLIDQLQHDYSGWVAGAIASAIFATLHLLWEGAEQVPQLPGLWLLGMVLVLALWADHNTIGLAWGLHAGWVWAIASFDTTQCLTPTHQNPTWLTGSTGKPLSGIIGILFLLVIAAIVWLSAFL